VHVAAAEFFGADDLADCRLHQRWASQEDRALVLDDDRLVAHRGHIGTARSTRAHHHRDLRDALRTEVGLVVEDAAEVFAIREHVVLVGQVGAAGVDQVDARQPVHLRDLLCAQVLLHRQRVVGATLHGGIVADDQAFDARDAADAGDHAGTRRGVAAVLFLVDVERRQGPDLEKRRVRIEQPLDALARQQLAAALVLGARVGRAALRDARELRVQVVDLHAHRGGVGLEVFGTRIELARQLRHHIVSANSSRPISMRRISLVPAPISYNFASRHRRPVGNSLV
jgi:hypothetical protein